MENEARNVFVVTCVKSGCSYVSVRKCGMKSYQAGLKAGVRNGHKETIIQSIRHYGFEAHTFRLDSVHENPTSAWVRKVEIMKLHGDKSKSLCERVPNWATFNMVVG